MCQASVSVKQMKAFLCVKKEIFCTNLKKKKVPVRIFKIEGKVVNSVNEAAWDLLFAKTILKE